MSALGIPGIKNQYDSRMPGSARLNNCAHIGICGSRYGTMGEDYDKRTDENPNRL